MKFEITMKDPDGFFESVNDISRKSVSAFKSQLSAMEEDEIIDARREELTKVLEKWFEYDEYVTLVVDTGAMTCVVKEREMNQ